MIREKQRIYKSKRKSEKNVQMSYFPPSSYPELLVYTQTYKQIFGFSIKSYCNSKTLARVLRLYD